MSERIVPYQMDNKYSINIDTEYDFTVAELIEKKLVENILYLCQGGMINVFNEVAGKQKLVRHMRSFPMSLLLRVFRKTTLNFDIVLKSGN